MAGRPRPSKPAREPQLRASWILTGVLGAFFLAVFAFAPASLPPFKQRMLAFACALLAGTCAVFWTGSLALQLHWLTSRFGKVAVRAGGGLAVFVLVLLWWESPLAPVAAAGGVHRVRVTVLGPDGVPSEGSEVWSSLGGEAKKVTGGWELDVPLSGPAGGPPRRLTVYAAQPAAFLRGAAEVELGEDREPAVTVRLRADRSARVRGIVVDDRGRPLAGARVSADGGGSAVTGPEGGFDLAAGAAPGQQVLLRAEVKGFAPLQQYHPAGSGPAVLRLEKE